MVNVPPVWFFVLLGIPLAAMLTHWIANRPEKHADLEPGETELEFGDRVGVSVRISHEYLCEFLYDLREKFEYGWSLGQVATILACVVDRRKATWSGRYVVTAAGTVGEVHFQFSQLDQRSVLCGIEYPPAFQSIFSRHLARFPAKLI